MTPAQRRAADKVIKTLEDLDGARGPIPDYIDALEEIKEQVTSRIDAAREDLDR